jgi:hypothetical protein
MMARSGQKGRSSVHAVRASQIWRPVNPSGRISAPRFGSDELEGMTMSGRTMTARLTTFTGIAALGIVTGAAPAARADTGSTPAEWHIAEVGEGARYGWLADVVALGPRNAWAFGAAWHDEGPFTPIAHRWNGRSWKAVRLPAGLERGINIADASGPRDVWAFGGGDMPGDAYALRWDGRTWRVAGRWPGRAYMADAEVIGPRDVWVFGNSRIGESIGTWHYDGRRWTRVDPPLGSLEKASAVASDDIWAIGVSAVHWSGDLLARWDGRTWNEVTIPGLPREDDHNVLFRDIYAASSQDVWIVGSEQRTDGETQTYSPLVLHFDGNGWQRIDPAPDPGAVELVTVTSDGRGGVWIRPVSPEPQNGSQLLHYGKGRWTEIRPESPDNRAVDAYDATAVPRSSSAWSVGRVFSVETGQSDWAIWRNGPFPR